MIMSLRVRSIAPLLIWLTACAVDGADEAASAEEAASASESEQGEPPPISVVCDMQQDEESCNGIPPQDNDDGPVASCYWHRSFAVTLVDGACEFGELSEGCRSQAMGDSSCPAVGPVCGGEQVSVRFWDGEMVLGMCRASDCVFDDNGELVDGPPECACLCDPGVPVEL